MWSAVLCETSYSSFDLKSLAPVCVTALIQLVKRATLLTWTLSLFAVFCVSMLWDFSSSPGWKGKNKNKPPDIIGGCGIRQKITQGFVTAEHSPEKVIIPGWRKKMKWQNDFRPYFLKTQKYLQRCPKHIRLCLFVLVSVWHTETIP